MFPWLRPLCPQLDQTGQHLFCVCGTRVNILEVASGAVLRSLEQEDQEDITAFDLSPDDKVCGIRTGGGLRYLPPRLSG